MAEKTYEEAKKEADEARVTDVASYIEGLHDFARPQDQPWLERAAKLLRRWGIDLK